MKLHSSVNLVVFCLGLLSFAAGVYLIYPPAALIGCGLILMAISLFGERGDRKK